MRIRDILRRKGDTVATVGPDATVRQLLAVLAEHNIGAVVVSPDGTSISGIVSERDVVRRLHDGAGLLDRPVSDIMTAEVRSCGPGDQVEDLRRTMTEHRFRHVPVVEDGHRDRQHRRRRQERHRRAGERARAPRRLHPGRALAPGQT